MEWDVIHSYSRAQAIEDGVLVDLTQYATTRGHFRAPVACTAGVWTLVETASTRRGQTIELVLSHIYGVARAFMRGAQSAAGSIPAVMKLPVAIPGTKPIVTWLTLHGGPGDDGELVLTLMLEGED